MSNAYIPLRFRNEILAHLMGVFSSRSNEFPLILGIFGDPGEGKTYMCEQLLLDFHVQRHNLSISEFEDELSGVPVKKLREKYDKIVTSYVEHQVYGVLMINDIDTAIGNWGDLHQYTVNTQHIIGELMQISDPHNDQKKRIPIIITGNNFSTIYAPLKRSGRIARFYWKPDIEDLKRILETKYTELSRREIEKLIKELNSYAMEILHSILPISFFTALKSKLYKQSMYEILKQQTTLHNMVGLFDNQYKISKIRVEDLINAGKTEIDLIAYTDEKHLGIGG